MAAADVIRLLGHPCDVINIADGTSVWYYRPWTYGNCLWRKTGEVGTYAEVPYEYGKAALVFNESGTLEAKTYVGEDTSIDTIYGKIPGDSLDRYWNYRNEQHPPDATQDTVLDVTSCMR